MPHVSFLPLRLLLSGVFWWSENAMNELEKRYEKEAGTKFTRSQPEPMQPAFAVKDIIIAGVVAFVCVAIFFVW